jgi:hypothetical protein
MDDREREKRKNDTADRHDQGSKRDGNQTQGGGNRRNEAPPKGNQTDGDKYDS